MITIKQLVSGESRSQEIYVEEDEVNHSSQSQQGFWPHLSLTFFFVSNCVPPPLRTHGKSSVTQI